MNTKPVSFHDRRGFLLGASALAVGPALTEARIIAGALPWAPNAGDPPLLVSPDGWQFFSPGEAAIVEALADRIIPPDDETPGGKDAGCAVFVDRQLAGPYGRQDGLYEHPPFHPGAKSQGPQTSASPAQQYRAALAALENASRGRYGGKSFTEISDADRDTTLKAIESGELALEGVDGKAFFEQVIKDVQMGFFADPVYGGNRDMVGWKMIGYPGARYNYLDWVKHHNQRFPLPPVGIRGRAEWTPKSG